eukprot:360341-Chlamydomonas_euryale.AAC.15
MLCVNAPEPFPPPWLPLPDTRALTPAPGTTTALTPNTYLKVATVHDFECHDSRTLLNEQLGVRRHGPGADPANVRVVPSRGDEKDNLAAPAAAVAAGVHSVCECVRACMHACADANYCLRESQLKCISVTVHCCDSNSDSYSKSDGDGHRKSAQVAQ